MLYYLAYCVYSTPNFAFQKYSLAESFTESRRQRLESSVEESSSTTSTAAGLDNRLNGSRHLEASPPRVRASETAASLPRTATSSEGSVANGSTRPQYGSDELEGPDYGRYNTSGVDTDFFPCHFLASDWIYTTLTFLSCLNFKIPYKIDNNQWKRVFFF